MNTHVIRDNMNTIYKCTDIQNLCFDILFSGVAVEGGSDMHI